MNKWSRNSIYGAGLASLLYLGCGNSVQNKDIKVQEDIDLGLADRNLDDFYQPTDSSLEDRINPIDSRELDYPSEDYSSEQNDLIAPDSLEYDNNLDQSLNDLSRDDYSIDLGSDRVNEDTGLDYYVSSDSNYCNSLEINSPEWCENCNIPPIMVRAWFQDEETNPNHEYGEDESFYVCIDVNISPNKDDVECYISASVISYDPCSSCLRGYFAYYPNINEPRQEKVYTGIYDTCTRNNPSYWVFDVTIIPEE